MVIVDVAVADIIAIINRGQGKLPSPYPLLFHYYLTITV